MICSIILGRKGSTGLPGKNNRLINGKPLCWHSMRPAADCALIDRHFVSSDDEKIFEVADQLGFERIVRPEHLCTDDALGDDAYKHAYSEIIERIGGEVEFLVLLFCNAPTYKTHMIEDAVRALRADPDADSAVTVGEFNMYSPIRARRLSADGYLEPFVDHSLMPESESFNCDRNSQGSVFFCDVALAVIRPRNLNNIEQGLLPQRWMGKKILPIKNEAGLDLDYEWQIGQLEWWLGKYSEMNS